MKTLDLIFVLIYIALAIAFVWRIFFSKNKNAKKTIYFGFHIIYFALAIGFVWSFKKIIDIQYFSEENYAEIGEKIKPKPIKDFPKRGTIYCEGRNGEKLILSEDLPVYNIFFNGEHIHAIEKAIKDGDIIMSVKRAGDTIATKRRFREKDNMNDFFNATDSIKLLANQMKAKFGSKAVGYDELMKAYREKNPKARLLLDTIIDFNFFELQKIENFALFNGRGKYGSCLVKEEKANRIFPFGDLARVAIGNVDRNKDGGFNKGKYGIEAQFDSIMRGVAGEKQNLKISINKEVIKIDPKTRKKKGADITLTLDMEIQEIAYNALREKAQKLSAERACVIVMEVETGEIKAMVNLGENHREKGNTFNMATSSLTELGSVFKVPSMIVALEKGLVTPETLVEAGSTKYRISEAEGHNFGLMSASEVLVRSSNKGIANIIGGAFENKPKEYIEALKKTYIDAPMNFDLPTASINIENITKNDLPARAIGYVAMPPIYMLRFYNAIANNGKMVEPFLVKDISKVEDGKRKSIKEANIKGKNMQFPAAKKVVADSICSKNTLLAIKKMLFEVVNSKIGTGFSTQKTNVVFAGKTGTAQMRNGDHQGTFCGYFPIDAANMNAQPKYSCIVVIYKKGGVVWGSQSCDVFRNIAEQIFIMETTREFAQLDNVNRKDRKIAQLSKKIGVK